MFTTYTEFLVILNDIGLNKFYRENLSNKRYTINYGPKKGVFNFNGILDAGNNYNYKPNSLCDIHIDKQLKLLDNPINTINNVEIVLRCIEIFDWGRVQESNIIKAIDLFRQNMLIDFLISYKNWFENDNILKIDFDKIIWSSGWTKVYSFMFNKTAIYDSRVAAFINYILIKFYREIESGQKKDEMKSIISNLVSFNGIGNRKRRISKNDRKSIGIRNYRNDNINLIANKLASWILRYIARIEYLHEPTQSEFRNIDKAAFMLGFDIEQIDNSVEFE